MFCAPFCQNAWIADNYCDDACNVKSCGYDAGDCGIQKFSENLYHVPFNFNSSLKDWNFTIPDRQTVAYWDMTKVFNQYVQIGIIPIVHHKGLQENTASIIRAISFSDAHKVLTLVLYQNVGPTTLNVEIRKSVDSAGDSEVIHNFFIHVNTKNSTIVNETIKETDKIDSGNKIELPEIKPEVIVTEKIKRTTELKKDALNVITAKDGNNLNKDNEIKQSNLKRDNNFSANKVDETKEIKPKKSVIDDNIQRGEANNSVIDTPVLDPVKVNAVFNNSETHSDKRLDPFQNAENVKNATNDKNREILLADKAANDILSKKSTEKRLIPKKVNRNGTESNMIPLNKNIADVQNNNSFHQQTKNKGEANLENNLEDMPKGIEDKKDNKNTSENKIETFPKLNSVEMKGVDNNNNKVVEKPNLEQNIPPVNIENPIENIKGKDNNSFAPEIKENIQNHLANLNRKLLSLDNKNVGDVANDYLDDNVVDLGIASDNTINNGVESWKNPALDIYGNSLLYTNRQFDIAYGYNARKVIAHMPHLVDLNIINLMYEKFPIQWSVTSSHQLRSAEDMQFEFSYFHFLISEKLRFNIGNVFDEFDTDQSKSWSDREIRTLLTRIYSLPLMPNTVLEFEELITGCSLNISVTKYLPQPIVSDYPPFERYYDSKLPTIVTKELVTGLICLRNI